MRKLTSLALTAIVVLSGRNFVLASELRLYGDQELREAKQVYEPNIRAIFRQDLIRRLPHEQRYALSDVRLVMPLRGKHPLQFSARPNDRSVIAPVLSVKFLDELTIAWAWFHERGCRTEYLTSYLSLLLGFRKIDAGPLEAFNLPQSVIKNERVNSLSLKLHKTAVYFLLAHEAGHLFYGHRPYTGGPASQQQEQTADDFALSAMASVGVMPAGMIQYFIAAYMYEPLPDLDTWEFESGQIAELTHPLTNTRVRRIADRIAMQPLDYAHSERNLQLATQAVVYAAKQMAGIAEHMEHGGVRLYSAGWLTEHFPSSRFATACPAR
ncbi:MAG: hypothetical protein OES38_00030 [Gammaproteobacteria bacterium]|nr:hypothetical protein [Gammaproteobacteria bacterium]